MHPRTVERFLATPTFPEYKSHPRHKRSGIDRYKPYLLEQWQNGRYNAKQMFTELQQQDFKGSYTVVVRYVLQLWQTLPSRPSSCPFPG